MSEAQEATAVPTNGSKRRPEVTPVQMEDGRTVNFTGNRKMDKNALIDEDKIKYNDDGSVLILPGAISSRIDFRNGKSVICKPPVRTLIQASGHGLGQKLGDEASAEKDIDDAFLAIEELSARLEKDEWNVVREGGGFSGASVVIRALMEATGRDQQFVKDYLQKQLDTAKSKGESLTRAALYASFRNPQTEVGRIVKRLEEEKLSKTSAVDADAELAKMREAMSATA